MSIPVGVSKLPVKGGAASLANPLSISLQLPTATALPLTDNHLLSTSYALGTVYRSPQMSPQTILPPMVL